MNRPSLFKAAVQARCPRCGEGALFAGYLRVVPICAYCGQSFANFATDDGLEIMVKPLDCAEEWVVLEVWIPCLSNYVSKPVADFTKKAKADRPLAAAA